MLELGFLAWTGRHMHNTLCIQNMKSNIIFKCTHILFLYLQVMLRIVGLAASDFGDSKIKNRFYKSESNYTKEVTKPLLKKKKITFGPKITV